MPAASEPEAIRWKTDLEHRDALRFQHGTQARKPSPFTAIS